MPRAAATIVRRVRTLVAARRVRFTLKALRELAALGLDALDACDALAGLRTTDLVATLKSTVTGEWMHVFKPSFAGIDVYVKLIVRAECVIVSFHEDEVGDEEDH